MKPDVDLVGRFVRYHQVAFGYIGADFARVGYHFGGNYYDSIHYQGCFCFDMREEWRANLAAGWSLSLIFPKEKGS